jgi:hypothetical protein
VVFAGDAAIACKIVLPGLADLRKSNADQPLSTLAASVENSLELLI